MTASHIRLWTELPCRETDLTEPTYSPSGCLTASTRAPSSPPKTTSPGWCVPRISPRLWRRQRESMCPRIKSSSSTASRVLRRKKMKMKRKVVKKKMRKMKKKTVKMMRQRVRRKRKKQRNQTAENDQEKKSVMTRKKKKRMKRKRKRRVKTPRNQRCRTCQCP